MNIFKRQKDGFAMVTVLLMTGLLLILMVALISLTSDTLYRSTADVERSTIVPLAEAAINEALLKIKLKPSWGTGNEKLLMRFNNQRVDIANIFEVNLPVDADSQSGLSYGNRGFYYISFDPNDGAFNGKKYISVNNLDPVNNPPASTVGWRGKNIPNGTASIVVTAAVGNTVKHIEVLVKKTLSGKVTTGSRGTAVFSGINEFSLSSLNGTPSFHSNDPNVAINIGVTDASKCKILDEGTVSALGSIKVNNINQNASPYSTGSIKDVPDVDMQDLIKNNNIVFSTIPSGTYVVSADEETLYYSNEDDAVPADVISAPTNSFSKGSNILSDLIFTGPTIQFKDNFKVDYDPNDPEPAVGPKKTGNITIHNVTLDMDITTGKGKGAVVEGYTLYTPGNGTRDYTNTTPVTGAPYKYGNMKVINNDTKDVIKGRGNFYSNGVISFEGKSVAAGYSPEQVALLSDGDIELDIKDDAVFSGLVYTKGDFISNVAGKNFTIQGALIAAGKETADADYDPGEISVTNSDNVRIIFDDTILSMFTYGGGSANGFTIASWHEF